ncbi:MAG: hypothetical protein GYB65_18910 [Chloroflexi bacterium]|nr:hypothetical protein [Chloroflexota bacterium]
MFKQIALVASIVTLILVAVVTALMAAPESEAGGGSLYDIRAVANQRTARPGNTDVASLFISVNNEFGVVYGLAPSSFDVMTGYVALGGCNVEIASVAEAGSGLYKMDLVPFTGNPSCQWLAGNYSLGIIINGPSGSGSTVVTLPIR